MRYIWNKYTKITIIFILITLVISGSSTFWLSRLLSDSGNIIINFSLLIGSFLLTSIPNVACSRALEQAEFAGVEQYVHDYTNVHKDKPDLHLDKGFREKQEPWLTSTARGVIKSAQMVIYGSLYSISSFLTDAISMSVIVNPLFAAGYGGGALLYILTTFGLRNTIAKYAERTLTADKSWTAIMLKGWDNIVMGNSNNLNLWNTRFGERFYNSRNTAVNNATFSRIASSIVTTIAFLPILGITAWLFLHETSNLGEKVLLLAILPRQAQTMSYFDALSNTIIEWAGTRKNLLDLSISVTPDFVNSRPQPEYKIFWDKLSFSKSNDELIRIPSLKNFLMMISNAKNGRFTIRGDNGSGKSVLMCKLKQHLSKVNKQAFYLPASSQLSFNVPTDELSTGQKKASEIKEIAEQQGLSHLLLDEWDGPLDDTKKREISKTLDELSKQLCVVEIRHRVDHNEEKKSQSEISCVGDSKPILVSFKEKHSIKKPKPSDAYDPCFLSYCNRCDWVFKYEYWGTNFEFT